MTVELHREMRALYTPTERAERLIAAGRLVLAIFSLIAIWSDPTTPSRWQSATYTLLGAYTAYALVAALISVRRPLLTRRGRVASHLFDLAIFSAFIFLTEGPISPFFLYFVFSVFCATLRFESRGLIATASAALGIYIVIGLWGSLVMEAPGFEPDRFLIRCVYLVVLAALLYYLQTYQRTLQAELTSLAEWPRELPQRFEEVLIEGLERAGELLRSQHVALIWEDEDEPWIHVVELEGAELRIERLQPTLCTPVVAAELENVAFTAIGPAVGVAGTDVRIQLRTPPMHRYWMERWTPASIVSAPFRGESASGQLVALDSRNASIDDIVLAELVSRLIASRIDQFRLLERIGEAASAAERLRISRDLHDGVLQSLSGVALRVRALEHEIDHDPSAARRAVTDILKLLEEDQREIRAMVRGLRITDAAGGDTELAARLEALRERMLAEWSVDLDLDGVPPNAEVGSIRADIVHIVSEAAANACRHGRASRVHVRFAAREDSLLLQITDNGAGFPFTGRLDSATLRNRGLGPRSLLERVESLGGSMEIESGKGGSVLDISLDTRRNAA